VKKAAPEAVCLSIPSLDALKIVRFRAYLNNDPCFWYDIIETQASGVLTLKREPGSAAEQKGTILHRSRNR
jgi:hypothetical protein